VAIDMCSIYASAVRRMLPKAMLVVDLFHVGQLAVQMTVDVRRRVARAKYGRRGRSGDPEHSVKRLLGGNVEDLSGAQFAKIIETLAQDRRGPGRRALRSHRPPDGDRPGRLALVAQAVLTCGDAEPGPLPYPSDGLLVLRAQIVVGDSICAGQTSSRTGLETARAEVALTMHLGHEADRAELRPQVEIAC
jgi:Transposase